MTLVAPPQLSPKLVGAISVTTAVQRLGSVSCVTFAGQLIIGSVVSTIVNTSKQVSNSSPVSKTPLADLNLALTFLKLMQRQHEFS